MMVCIISLIPVSYTHLDVYKRQLDIYTRIEIIRVNTVFGSKRGRLLQKFLIGKGV